MKKMVWITGTIMGLLLCIPWLVTVNLLYSDPQFKSNDLIGYTVLLVIFSLIFVGVRNHREKNLGGNISFGKAFKTGVYITLVAGTVYVLAWICFFYLVVPDFMEVYTEHVLYQCTTESEREAKATEMAHFSSLYEKPFFVVLITYAEVLPLGFVVSLVSALSLKKKGPDDFRPAA